MVWRVGYIIILYRGVNYKYPFEELCPSTWVDLESADGIQFASTRNSLNTSLGRMNGNLPLDTSREYGKIDLVNKKK